MFGTDLVLPMTRPPSRVSGGRGRAGFNRMARRAASRVGGGPGSNVLHSLRAECPGGAAGIPPRAPPCPPPMRCRRPAAAAAALPPRHESTAISELIDARRGKWV